MDDFWSRVTVEQPTTSLSSSGAEVLTWSALLSDVEARVLPLMHDERLETWATPEEEAYEIQLRGAHAAIQPHMRVAVDGRYFDIRDIQQPPPFGTPTTVLHAILVTP